MNNHFQLFRHFKEDQEDDKQVEENDHAQGMNMKRMKVNAQVTAITAILESIGNVTYVIHILFTGPRFSAMIHGQVPYMIVLPYVFLMNTSHNKNRIVEHGWKNVLRNIIGRSECNEANERINSDPVEEYRNDKIQQEEKIGNIEKDAISVPTISTKHDKWKEENFLSLSLHTPFHEDSTSEPKGKILKKGIKSNGVILNPNTLPRTDRKQLVAQNILYFMIQNVKNEEIYISFFKKLLLFEDSQRNKNSLSEREAHDEIIKCFKSEITGNYANGHMKKLKQDIILAKSYKDDSIISSQDSKVNLSGPSSSKLSIKAENRCKLRIEILNQMSPLCYEDEIYKALLEDLIDLEESFVTDN